ncbi:ribosomal protein L5 domain-containing protein [Catenaria anguillulae PL171]|uniref:Ribosomal protein L5 domain-containing protein n=1 Tax=Catenaria anguillulae PL171 TaxID=765915 RepID=A0A1Y2HIV7_9FUNG|nr:ribosomal protein L5 domain-containing protein [Catenaria anguillulae PL171]
MFLPLSAALRPATSTAVAAAAAASSAARVAAYSTAAAASTDAPADTPTRTFPTPLPRDDIPLPQSLFNPKAPTPAPSRLHSHFESTLYPDLMYLTYNHKDPGAAQRLPQNKYVPGLNEHNADFKKHETPRYYDTSMRKPHPARTAGNQPKLQSIVVHTFLKEAIENKYVLLNAMTQLEAITGKFPDVVELDGDDMLHFVDKLVELVLPRLKNWYGISATAGDGTGNIKLRFEPKVMSYFPEIEQTFDRYPFMCAFDVTFKTSAYDDWEARVLLSGLQVPVENAASKAKREKYMQKDADGIDPNEPEWMKFKRAREAMEAKNKKKK